MPELPEVETIRRHLAPRVEGRVLARLERDLRRWIVTRVVVDPFAP